MTKKEAKAIVVEMANLLIENFPDHEDIEEFKLAVKTVESRK